MSHSHGILLPRVLAEQELRHFVEDEGGQWQSDPVLPQGFIGDDDVWLFIRGIDDQIRGLRQYSSEELVEAESACGTPLVACLSVDHTKGARGRALAARVIAKMIARWGGYHFDGG